VSAAPNPAAAPPSILHAALRGECPRCGAATLFAGPVRFADRCRACGLDFSAYNVGDGPAAFLTLAIGALLCAAALTLHFTLHPPFWVHVLLWVPLTSAAVVLALRMLKAAMLIHEHRAEVREGRLTGPDPGPAPDSDRDAP